VHHDSIAHNQVIDARRMDMPPLRRRTRLGLVRLPRSGTSASGSRYAQYECADCARSVQTVRAVRSDDAKGPSPSRMRMWRGSGALWDWGASHDCRSVRYGTPGGTSAAAVDQARRPDHS
jgi:hypothetical protein